MTKGLDNGSLQGCWILTKGGTARHSRWDAILASLYGRAIAVIQRHIAFSHREDNPLDLDRTSLKVVSLLSDVKKSFNIRQNDGLHSPSGRSLLAFLLRNY